MKFSLESYAKIGYMILMLFLIEISWGKKNHLYDLFYTNGNIGDRIMLSSSVLFYSLDIDTKTQCS